MKAWLNFPKGVAIIAFGNLWDTFSYYGTQTIIVLYLMHVFHFSSSTSYLIYGSYVALTFSTPFFGGMIADRYLGAKNTVIFGSILAIFGNILLAVPNLHFFYIGLSTTLIGSGLYKSNSTALIGSLYKDTAEKEKGFTLLYLAMNIGGTISPLLYGLAVYKFNWGFGFLISGLGILIALLLFLFNLKNLPVKNFSSKKMLLGLLFSVAAIVLLSYSFLFYGLIIWVPLCIFFVGIGYLFMTIINNPKEGRKSLFALLLLCFFAMFYFAAGMQIGTTITLFIQESIPNFALPASTFNMLYSGFVLILAPFVGIFWRYLKYNNIEVRVAQKVILGISLGCLGILCFAVAALLPFKLTCIITGYVLLSAGELIIAPAMYTAISNNSPDKLKGIMMGCWFLFIGMGSYLSGIFSKVSKSLFVTSFTAQFLFVSLITFLAILCLFFSINWLDKQIK